MREKILKVNGKNYYETNAATNALYDGIGNKHLVKFLSIREHNIQDNISIITVLSFNTKFVSIIIFP